jgi:hypothetical protein
MRSLIGKVGALVAGMFCGCEAKALLVGAVEMGLEVWEGSVGSGGVTPVADRQGEDTSLFEHREDVADGGGFRDGIDSRTFVQTFSMGSDGFQRVSSHQELASSWLVLMAP